MGIFDRLTRLARSEANHLLDSASDALDSASDTARGFVGSRDRPAPAPESPPADAWPTEIREDYAALELPLGADREAVKDAYREMMRRYHPDRHTGDPSKAEVANELTVRIRQSYERLDAYLAKRG